MSTASRHLLTIAFALGTLLMGTAMLAQRDSTRPDSPANAHKLETFGRGTAAVIRVDDASRLEAVASELRRRGYKAIERVPELRAIRVASTDRPTFETGAGVLAGIPGIIGVEQARPVHVLDSPTDPLYPRQATYLSAVQAPSAWNIERGRPEIVVAVVDTGIDLGHPDLLPNLWINPGEVPNNGADDDANGCTDDVNGCSFVTDSSPGCERATNGFVRDDDGHGTFVAGVIAAAGNNQGMVGVARGVRIMAVKVLDCYGAGDTLAVAQGILYAARNGASVINVSLGGIDDSTILADAVRSAIHDYGVLVVAAAGNDGGEQLQHPARLPDVLAVGAASRTNPDRRASFSNTGDGLDVVAVGEDIVGTVPKTRCWIFAACIDGGPYGISSGTSFSTPQVTALVALLRSQRAGLSPSQLTYIIRSTATKVPAGDRPGWAGAGRVNMLSALKFIELEPCVVATVIDGDTFTCTNGKRVRMLQVDAPDLGQCGGEWAKAAAEFIFLRPGSAIALQYDVLRSAADGTVYAAPVVRGTDGVDYNVSIVMAYVGLAKAAEVAAGNTFLLDWAQASQTWAQVAQWNMWAPGKPFTGGC